MQDQTYSHSFTFIPENDDYYFVNCEMKSENSQLKELMSLINEEIFAIGQRDNIL
jgi:hypothetical protein